MGAGLSGSTRMGVNVNLNSGGGNKLQGLPPSHREFNKIPKNIFSKSLSSERNVVFNMNQLTGGIGRKNTDKSSGRDGADGSKGVLHSFYVNRNRLNVAKCLRPAFRVKVIRHNGQFRYVLNNLPRYHPHFGVGMGIYIFRNIPFTHPLALLNKGNSKITYKPIDSGPIIINVAGGAQTPDANGDYYTFTLGENRPIGIVGGGEKPMLRFMRGRTYRFVANGIDAGHPFKLFIGGAFINESGISGSGAVTEFTIPADHSTTPGDMYYQCANHPAMQGIMLPSFDNVVGTHNNGNYDFYYGDVRVTIITGNFNVTSLFCLNHKYMGGFKMLKYTPVCKL